QSCSPFRLLRRVLFLLAAALLAPLTKSLLDAGPGSGKATVSLGWPRQPAPRRPPAGPRRLRRAPATRQLNRLAEQRRRGGAFGARRERATAGTRGRTRWWRVASSRVLRRAKARPRVRFAGANCTKTLVT